VRRKVCVETERRYLIVIEAGEDADYSAYAPDLPGCVATGATLEKCERKMRDAIALHVAAISGHAPLGRFERRGTARRAGSCARAAWPAAGRRAPTSPADRELEPRLLAAKCAGQVTFETGVGPVCRSAADEGGPLGECRDHLASDARQAAAWSGL
jgi:predicted RNase H-like HicB family nuclease